MGQWHHLHMDRWRMAVLATVINLYQELWSGGLSSPPWQESSSVTLLWCSVASWLPRGVLCILIVAANIVLRIIKKCWSHMDKYVAWVAKETAGTTLLQRVSFIVLKTELIYTERYATRDEAKQCVFQYVEVYYNRVRRHSAIVQ